MMDYSRLENIEIDGLNYWDYPDLVDAFISYAEIDGQPLTDDELDQINENSDFVHECALEWFH